MSNDEIGRRISKCQGSLEALWEELTEDDFLFDVVRASEWNEWFAYRVQALFEATLRYAGGVHGPTWTYFKDGNEVITKTPDELVEP